jgi:hypothetical protein
MPTRMQGGKQVDAAHELPIPATAAAAGIRNERVGKTVPKTHQAAVQPYHEPSASGHPALKALKKATHVHEVFKKR